MRDYLEDIESGKVKNPETAAQEAMRPQLPKRFYEKVSVAENEDGLWEVQLDGRLLKTPARRSIALPNKAAAKLVAAEWQAQEKHVDPASMPTTRLVNTAIDGIAEGRQAVIEDMLKYAGNDLLSYRASTPKELVSAQREHWDPILERCATELGAQFEIGEGVIHVPQSAEAVDAIGLVFRKYEHTASIAALHTMTTLTGSLLLTVALALGWLDVKSAWAAAHVDEAWNARQWGEDYEAASRLDIRKEAFMASHALLVALEG